MLVEHVVAEHHWRTDPDTIWFGGNHAGFDVESNHGRTDAKTAWLDPNHPDRLYFAAPRDGFDPNRVDHIAPVILDMPRIGFRTLNGGGGQVVATYQSARLWMIPVAVVNPHLNYEAKGRSSVALDAVADYEVRRRG